VTRAANIKCWSSLRRVHVNDRFGSMLSKKSLVSRGLFIGSGAVA
jgi:hypothetical protein